MGDLPKLEKYLTNHYVEPFSTVDANPQRNDKGSGKGSDKGSLVSYTPQYQRTQIGQLEQWLEMTQYGLGRHDSVVSPHAPLLRLMDALMSLNYLIATGIIQFPLPSLSFPFFPSDSHPSPTTPSFSLKPTVYVYLPLCAFPVCAPTCALTCPSPLPSLLSTVHFPLLRNISSPKPTKIIITIKNHHQHHIFPLIIIT